MSPRVNFLIATEPGFIPSGSKAPHLTLRKIETDTIVLKAHGAAIATANYAARSGPSESAPFLMDIRPGTKLQMRAIESLGSGAQPEVRIVGSETWIPAREVQAQATVEHSVVRTCRSGPDPRLSIALTCSSRCCPRRLTCWTGIT